MAALQATSSGAKSAMAQLRTNSRGLQPGSKQADPPSLSTELAREQKTEQSACLGKSCSDDARQISPRRSGGTATEKHESAPQPGTITRVAPLDAHMSETGTRQLAAREGQHPDAATRIDIRQEPQERCTVLQHPILTDSASKMAEQPGTDSRFNSGAAEVGGAASTGMEHTGQDSTADPVPASGTKRRRTNLMEWANSLCA